MKIVKIDEGNFPGAFETTSENINSIDVDILLQGFYSDFEGNVLYLEAY